MFLTYNKHTGKILQIVSAPEDEMAWYVSDDVDVTIFDPDDRLDILAGSLRVSLLTGNLTRLQEA